MLTLPLYYLHCGMPSTSLARHTVSLPARPDGQHHLRNTPHSASPPADAQVSGRANTLSPMLGPAVPFERHQLLSLSLTHAAEGFFPLGSSLQAKYHLPRAVAAQELRSRAADLLAVGFPEALQRSYAAEKMRMKKDPRSPKVGEPDYAHWFWYKARPPTAKVANRNVRVWHGATETGP